jgi:arginine N-succinyltransferase
MFILRSVAENDLEALKRLSEIVFFINLPNDEEIIRKKIANSIESFTSPSSDLSENTYIFVMEDMSNNQIVGVSMIHAQHGTEDEPHFYLKVSQEHKYSQTINTGFVHGTLKLGLDTNGPTEIGGLVIDPQYRGHTDKLGKQLSFVRFLYMANHAKEFKDTVLSELMPPLDKQGNSPLWEAIGRRFMNMNYIEADRLSRSNKEFILSLFPSDNIYQTLLPLEARNAIGKVGDETKPVKKMLESIGFHYSNEVDPFDGGPHYKSKLKDISVVKSFKSITSAKLTRDILQDDLMLEFRHPSFSFSATRIKGKIENGVLFFNPTKNEKIDQYILNSQFLNTVQMN